MPSQERGGANDRKKGEGVLEELPLFRKGTQGKGGITEPSQKI